MKTKKKEKTQRRRGLFISAAVLLSVGLWTLGTAQVKIGGDPTTPVTTGAVLELDGASGGLLLPRVQVLPPAASASEGTMYYQISDAIVYILLIDGGKHWEPVGKATKLAYGSADSAKLAGIASDANYVLVENILTSSSAVNALSAAQGQALLDSIRNRSSQGSTTLNAFRDSVYNQAQILAGNKTFSGTTTFSAVSPTVPSKSTAAGANPTVLATEAQVALKADLAGATFTGAIAVPNKTTAVTNNGTLVATEAQVYALSMAANPGLDAFRDSVYTKAQTLAGNKTFSGMTTFSVTSPTVPSKSAAAGNNPTVLATEAQVALKADLAGATFTGAIAVPNKITAVTNNGTLVATEAQVVLAQCKQTRSFP
ncbi:hypothetical protein AGMMS49525_16090 [Bacteroidia bacterium]|nr:hypothetical protein AGMMS49525_16090 [Bacteroidia bacterium]